MDRVTLDVLPGSRSCRYHPFAGLACDALSHSIAVMALANHTSLIEDKGQRFLITDRPTDLAMKEYIEVRQTVSTRYLH